MYISMPKISRKQVISPAIRPPMLPGTISSSIDGLPLPIFSKNIPSHQLKRNPKADPHSPPNIKPVMKPLDAASPTADGD
jgi:hypothetical protein